MILLIKAKYRDAKIKDSFINTAERDQDDISKVSLTLAFRKKQLNIEPFFTSRKCP